MSLVQTLFGFHGRIRRTTYWLAAIGSAVAVGVAGFMLMMVAAALGVGAGAAGGGASDEAGAAALGVMGGAALLWLLPLWAVSFWISLALAVKRCHDRNYPGVMILISLVPVIGWLWALIDLGFIDGTPGPNQYGLSPKGVPGTPTIAGAYA